MLLDFYFRLCVICFWSVNENIQNVYSLKWLIFIVFSAAILCFRKIPHNDNLFRYAIEHFSKHTPSLLDILSSYFGILKNKTVLMMWL